MLRVSFGKDSVCVSNDGGNTGRSKYNPPKALQSGKFITPVRKDSGYLQKEIEKVRSSKLAYGGKSILKDLPLSEDYNSLNDAPNLAKTAPVKSESLLKPLHKINSGEPKMSLKFKKGMSRMLSRVSQLNM